MNEVARLVLPCYITLRLYCILKAHSRSHSNCGGSIWASPDSWPWVSVLFLNSWRVSVVPYYVTILTLQLFKNTLTLKGSSDWTSTLWVWVSNTGVSVKWMDGLNMWRQSCGGGGGTEVVYAVVNLIEKIILNIEPLNVIQPKITFLKNMQLVLQGQGWHGISPVTWNCRHFH